MACARAQIPGTVFGEGVRDAKEFFMEQKMINARIRTEIGKGAAKRLRATGRLPAVMYDSTGKATLVDINTQEFAKLYHVITESTLIDVKLDGSKDTIAFVKDVQYNIITDTVGHVDFYEVDPAKHLRTKIPVRLTGSPAGVRLGGVLESGVSEIEVECFPKDLPPRVVVDVTELELNHSIHVKDIKLADGVKLLSDPHQTVATLKYLRADTAPAATAAAPDAAPAAADAAAKAAPAKAAPAK